VKYTLGTPHFQGYIEFRTKVGRRRCVTALGGRAHVEPRRGTQLEASKYCCDPAKAGFLDGPWQYGKPTDDTQGRRTDLDEFCRLALVQGMSACAEASPSTYVRNYRGIASFVELLYKPAWRQVRCFYFEGASGCGKSSLVYDTFGHDGVYAVPREYPLWFDNYRGQDILFLDEYQGLIVRETLLRLLDGHPVQLEVKGGFRHARYHCVVLASNRPFGLWSDDAVRRRFKHGGGYFRLSGERGSYSGLASYLRGEASEVADGLGVRRVVGVQSAPGGLTGDMPSGACHWSAPNK